MPDSMPTRFGPYELVRRLGEGGMGVVFEARDPRIGRHVALKVLNRDKAASATSAQRFEREAQMTAKLAHPNIASVFEAGVIGETLYFTMELVSGPSVADLLEKAGGGLEWRQACAIARDVALALAHAHEAGVYHRDVKPSNVLLDDSGRAKVLDFGLARDEDEGSRLTREGAILGTPGYMAPERFHKTLSREAGAAADVYSLGIMLYEMLAGWPPYDGDSIFEIVQQIREANPPPLELPPDAPPELASLTMRLIAKRPEDRPASALAVARALDALIGGRTKPRGPVGTWLRANPISFVVICAATPVIPVVLALVARGGAPATKTKPGSAAVTSATSVPPPVATVPAGLVNAARERLYAGDFVAATELYDRALALAPDDEDALTERAVIPALLDDLEPLLAARVKLARYEKNPAARVVLGVGAVSLGIVRDPGPRTAEERAHPLAPLLAVLRADAMGLNDTGEALVREALAARPRCGFIALRLVTTLMLRGKVDEATRLLEEERQYEGVAEDLRAAARGTLLERAGNLAEAERFYATVKAPTRVALRIRGRRAAIALARGDARAAVAAHEGHEAGVADDRLALAFAHGVLGHRDEARRVLDKTLDLLEEYGDLGALCHAAGDGKAVLEACHALYLATRESAATKDLIARTRGMRARYAARSGDFKTALADLETLGPGVPQETGVTDAVIRLYRGDYEGAVGGFLEVIQQFQSQLPRDALLEIGISLEKTGHTAAAKDTFERLAQGDPAEATLARQHIDAIDKWPTYPGEAVLIDQGPSATLMTGGDDGQGPRLFTSSRWVDDQQTIYGYAPTIFIPEGCEGRTVDIEVGSEQPVRIEILPGAVPKDDHAWWTSGHATVLSSEKIEPSPRLAWTAKSGTWTIFIVRFLEKDAELKPCPLSSVKVTLRGPPAAK